MKKTRFILLFVFGLLLITSCQDKDKSNLTLLSSEIPTDTPLVFSPDIISTDNNKDFAITFSPEMDELFFTRRKPKGTNEIYTSKLVDSKWSNPERAFLATNNGWDFQPHINPKGDRLYFGSTRPLNDTIKSSGVHEWYSEKNDGEWSNPKPLDKLFLDRMVMYLKSSKNDNLYFSSVEKGGRAKDGGIYYSINENGQYKSVKKMGEVINSNGDWIAHSYIAPDESYIIYSSEKNKNTDLFISFNLNGTWAESYSLGPKINTEQGESAPSVSPDGKYFFFSRSIKKVREDGSTNYLGNIYWIDFIRLKKELLENINSN